MAGTSDSGHHVVLIPGHGIGSEVTAAVKRVMAAASAPVEWTDCQAGLAALQMGRDVLPQETIDAIEHYHFALKGPCTTPMGEGFTSVNVQLRKRLTLYAAVRPGAQPRRRPDALQRRRPDHHA